MIGNNPELLKCSVEVWIFLGELQTADCRRGARGDWTCSAIAVKLPFTKEEARMAMQDNPVLQAIVERRSIRRFTGEEVSTGDVRTILEAGRWAPSGLNNQPWRFMILWPGEERVKALEECTKYAHIVRAAGCLVGVFLDRDSMYSELKDHQTAGACIQNMLLAAHSLGLGGVWLGEIVNQSSGVLEALELDPGTYEFMALIALGHPDQKGSSSRKPLEDLLIEEL